ncbi:InlB B-repeat-containing protein, partial [Bilifractor sp. LCP19S3_H10]|uniref:InlB B-repeat-containing protein n=1 Tax=Bilifractor sp. LCP19S3_H10 TaxID=3438736 RepID=UPI003F914312
VTPDSDMTLYAVWATGYKITFDGNGGKNNYSDDASSRWTQEVVKGSKIRFALAYREGYEFKGWSTDQNATEPEWTADELSSVTPDSDMTLYAVWATGYKITFDGNGGKNNYSDDASSRWTQEVVKGSKIRFALAYREGYEFKGWSTDQNATEPEWTADELSSVTPDSDMTLYAVWATGYKITFDGNGGKNNYSDDASSRWTQEVVKGSKIRFALAYREGYE